MKHAVIKNVSPEYFTGKFAVDSEGTQHPLRSMTKAQAETLAEAYGLG